MVTRRSLLLTAGAGAGLRGAPPTMPDDYPRTTPAWEANLFRLHERVRQPVKVRSIELLETGGKYFVRAVSSDGVPGVARCKNVEDYIPILLRRVVPTFLNQDARDLETLVDTVYIRNYKMAGQPFWCPVAFVEQALFDLLGRTVKKPVGELLGGVIRKEIPVYLSGSGRETTAEEEVAVYERALEMTGAKAVKFKIGGRMSRNADAYPGRTRKMLELARKRFPESTVLYADANGSYDAKAGIEVGRFLEALRFSFYEEPCPWEEPFEMKAVSEALSIPIAFGEQDSSFWKFQWLVDTKAIDIVQPDLNYAGGFTRTCRIARMARKAGLPITPHNTQTDDTACFILQFASAVENTGPYMEFPWRQPPKPASWHTPNFDIRNGTVPVPTGPGLGVDYDPAFLAKARAIRL
jgi:L-alanine-DL-glutamate epimerase-like enolase superfamily enzyme